MIRAALAALLVLAAAASGAPRPMWLPAKTLSAIGGSAPRVAVDGRGDVTVAWAQDEGTGHGVAETAFRPAGRPFGSSRIVSAPGLWAGPDLGVDQRGDATLVWATGDPPDVVLQVATRASGTKSFGPSTTLDGPHHFVFAPKIAVNPRGDAVAVWVATDSPLLNGSGRFVLRAAFRRAGGAFGRATEVYAVDGEESPSFELGIDNEGDAAVVLDTFRHPASSIEAFYRRTGGSFGAPRMLAVASDETTPNARFRFVDAPQVAMDARGDVLAAWTGLGSSAVVLGAYRPAGGSWEARTDVADTGACCNDAYRIAFDGRGRAIAAWIDNTETVRGDNTETVRFSTRTAAGAWWRPRALSPPGNRMSLVPPALAVGARGEVVVAWTDLTPAVPAISAVVRPPGGTFWPARGAWNGPGYPLNPLQLAVDAQGNAILAWQTAASVLPTDTGPNRQWIQAAGYDGAGPQLRGLDIPRRGRVGVAARFSVASVDVWSSVASTRWSFGDDAHATGTRASHVYRRPGRYTVTVTSTDTLGNATRATATLAVR